MSNQLQNEGPLAPTGGARSPRSAEAKQALENQLKEDFAKVQAQLDGKKLEELNPAFVKELERGVMAMGVLGGEVGTDEPLYAPPPWKDIQLPTEVDDPKMTPEELKLTKALTHVSWALEEAAELFERKNREYGNAIEFTGVLGCVVAATGDIARLRNMVLRSPDNGKGQAANVRDKMLDILVQAAIGIYMIDTGNWSGK